MANSEFQNYLKQLQSMVGGTNGSPCPPPSVSPTEGSDAPSMSAPAPVTTPTPAPNNFQDYLKQLQASISDTKPSVVPITVPEPSVVPAPVPEPSVSNYLANLQSISLNQPQTQSGQKKLKFLLVSTHCHQVTGYSKVCYGIIQELAKCSDWLDVTHFGFQRAGDRDYSMTRPYPPGIKVIDAAALELQGIQKNGQQQGQGPKQGFGYAELPAVIQEVKPNVIMIYNDLSVINFFMESIKRSGIKRDFATWMYIDQVYNCQLAGYLEMVNKEADRIFAFTQHWKECLQQQGIHRPIDIIGHGFDKRMFQTVGRDEARKRIGLPAEPFLFLSLNRNQPRKRYDLLIMAFVELIAKYPNKAICLLCVCDKGEKGGWWLFELFARELKLRKLSVEQFGNRLMIASREMNYTDDEINMMYNACDAGVSAVDGEGWGLCAFEQMGVGVPQVLPDLGGHKEFCNTENSIMVKPKHRFYMPMAYCHLGGEALAVDPHDLCLGMEEYINDSEKRKRHGLAAKDTVNKFTWPEVTKNLIKRLKARHENDD